MSNKFKLLCIIDMQNDFIDGSLGTPEAQAIIPKVVDKIENLDKTNTLILMTKDTHYNNYLDTLEGTILPIAHCIEGTKGWSINKEVSKTVKESQCMTFSSANIINGRIYKNTFASDVLEDFMEKHAKEIESVEIIGLCTDICVISNALMARKVLPDCEITVDSSCCAGTYPARHEAALEVMKSCQINVI